MREVAVRVEFEAVFDASVIEARPAFEREADRAPPRSWSSSAAKMLGESNRGAHHQSTTPCAVTSAAVWRSPTMPCWAIGG